MKYKDPFKNTLLEELTALKESASSRDVNLREILGALGNKSLAILLVLLSLPFCQPLQIPGVSTPFGLVLAILGLRLAIGFTTPWLPQKLLDKKIPNASLIKILDIGIKVSKSLKKFLKTRMTWLFSKPFLMLQGIIIVIMAVLLSLPLPIPFTNLISAIPIFLFGLGLLEEDGLCTILGYIFSALALIGFFLIFWFGTKGFSYFFG